MKNVRKITGDQMDDLMDYLSHEEERTGLSLEETGLYAVIKFKGGTIFL
ncbi:hypothetical protein LCM23_06690 [Cytobacillus kochii]|nr:hypothetical protein [Cytobacillus kochii]MCA1025774.1 hypothetical protein [Cytobacillus kochii]